MLIDKNSERKLLQICHGKLIPEYSSAYALRCVRYLKGWQQRSVISVGGLIFKDQTSGQVSQFRSLLLTGLAIIMGGRSLEVLISRGTLLRGQYRNTLEREVKNSEIIVLEGPWQYPLIKDKVDNKLVVYDAHNVESTLRKGNKWEGYVRELEKQLALRADLIITVSESDAKEFVEHLGVSVSKVVSIPEGFEKSKLPWNGIRSREIAFIGSAYLPNIDAAKRVIKLASDLPKFKFKIIGSVCNAVEKRGIPRNVSLLGVLNDEQKSLELSTSLLALNPVQIGSGRNLKINDYVSHGIPLITTEIGSRGFQSELRQLFFITDLDNFKEKINEVSESVDLLASRSDEMRQYAERNDYSSTQKIAYETISRLMKTS